MAAASRTLISALVALVVVLGIWMGIRGRRPPVPKAVWETRELSLGRVLAGESKDLAFSVKNEGGKDLRIVSVTGSCGCLNPQNPERVRPGKSELIRVRFEPAPQWSGQVQKELTALTDDPKEPEVKLHLTAEIDPIIAVDPPSPVQLPVHRGQTVTKVVRLTPRKGSGITLSEVKVGSPLVKAKLIPPAAADPEGCYRLQLTLGPCPPAVDVTGAVMIRTSAAQLPIANVVAVGLQQDGPVASPREILFSAMPSGAAGDRLTNLQVFTRSGAAFQVKNVKCTLPELATEVKADSPGRLYSLNVVRKEPLKTGRRTGEIVIQTSDPQTPQLKVPIDLTVN